MRGIIRHLERRFIRQNQVGQAIILMAFAMIMLLAFVGLVTDVGLLMVRYSQLRRAVDSASIAAAGQVRENRDYADIALTARQFIRLHGMDPNRVSVETCVTTITAADPDGDPELCGEPGESPRKLVRITAQVDSPTTFLQLIGWNNVILEASAVAETAVVDVALVLDTSRSMSSATKHNFPGPSDYDAAYSGGGWSIHANCDDDENAWQHPLCCNDTGDASVGLNGDIVGSSYTQNTPDGDLSDLVCEPFKQARDAARTFIQRLDFVRGDRVVLVTFDENGVVYAPDNPSPPPVTFPPLISDEDLAITTLNQDVGVHNDGGQTGGCVTVDWYNAGDVELWEYDFVAPCPDTNLGGGILRANEILTDPLYVRREAVWVMIVLSDGAASTTNPVVRGADNAIVNHDAEPGGFGDYGWVGYCPWYAFCDPDAGATTGDGYAECLGSPARPDPFPHIGINEPDPHDRPLCSDPDPYTRHWCLTTATDAPWAPGVPNLDALNCDTTDYVDYGTVANYYDPIDFAMDMADFAGLIEVQPNVPGNFIAMYTIGFIAPPDPANDSELVSAALGEYSLRYIADAGDNGVIDNNYQQDCRGDFTCGDDYGGDPNPFPAAPPNGLFYNPYDYPDDFGPPGPCEVDANTGQVFVPGDFEDCGQYWYAEQGTNDLDRIFAEIASRLFTRLAR